MIIHFSSSGELNLLNLYVCHASGVQQIYLPPNSMFILLGYRLWLAQLQSIHDFVILAATLNALSILFPIS